MRTMCTNPECRWSREYKGGKFVLYGRDWFCEECAPSRTVHHYGADTQRWNFTTTHLHPEGQPVQVQSLRHLRQLEGQYGVSCVAANQNEKSWGARG